MLDRIASRADYDRLRQSFQWDQRAEFNFGLDVVDAWASKRPDATALWWLGSQEPEKRSWAEISQRSSKIALSLLALGLNRGDRVLVMLPKIVPWWETMIGLLKAGLVAMPGTSLLTPRDLEYRLKLSEASAVVTDEHGAEKIDAIANVAPTLRCRILISESPRPGWQRFDELIAQPTESVSLQPTPGDDPALMYFTSGTTGMPKMVLHTHSSYGLGHAITGRLWLDLSEDDLHWNISDTGWAKAAWSSLFGPWFCGAAVFAQHSAGKFHPEDVLRILSEYPITTLCAAPTIYRLLVQLDLVKFQPKALRHCVAAGEPLNAEVISVWRKATGITIRDGYGQTETVLLCGNFPGVEVRPGSMGLPSPGFDLAVIDEAGERLPAGKPGRVAIRIDPQRPLGLFREYWRNPDATSQSFQQGWYTTGDCASLDEDGYFWFVGRDDDVITSSAYRIGPFEVESALIEHPAVVEAAVIGKPDPVRNEIVKAYVVLAKNWQPSDELKGELQEHVKRVTAPYKYPREIEFVTDLPKTVSGKIRRIELRQRAAAEASTAGE